VLIKRLKTADKALKAAERKKMRETGIHLMASCLYVRRKRTRMRRRRVRRRRARKRRRLIQMFF
jgi:hypothetical protein